MKPRLHETIDNYGRFIKDSWHHTMHQRSFLIIAFLASFAYSGAVFANMFNLVGSAGSLATFDRAVISAISPFAWVLGNLSFTSEVGFNLLGFTFGLLISLLFFVIGIFAQQILVNGIHRHSKDVQTVLTVKGQFNFRHLLDLGFLNVLIILTNIVILTIFTYILSVFFQAGSLIMTLGTIGTYAILFPLAFLVNAIAMQAIIRVVTHNTHTLKALQIAVNEVYHHPLAMLEIALGIFIVQSLFAVGLAALTFLMVLIVLLFVVSLAGASSAVSMFAITGFFLALWIGLVMLYIAIVTSFTFHAWINFSHHLHHAGITPIIHHMTDSIRLFWKKS